MTVTILHTSDLAAILGLSPKSIANRLSRVRTGDLEPESLPPIRRMNGRVCWRSDEVQSWIDSNVTLEGAA